MLSHEESIGPSKENYVCHLQVMHHCVYFNIAVRELPGIYEHATIKQFHVDKTFIMNSAEEDCWFKVSLGKGEPDKSLDFCWAILSVVAYNDLLSDQIKRRLIHTFLFLL